MSLSTGTRLFSAVTQGVSTHVANFVTPGCPSVWTRIASPKGFGKSQPLHCHRRLLSRFQYSPLGCQATSLSWTNTRRC